MTIQIEPVAIDGKFWIRLTMDDSELQPHGPYRNPDEAEIAAHQLASWCRVMHANVIVAAGKARKR